jgi:proline iminopeptidase
MDLVMVRQWAGYAGLDAQLAWIQVAASKGQSSLVDLGPGTLVGPGQDVAHWSVTVPKDGTLELEYRLELSCQDGEVPSKVWDERALLLTRSLFVLPAVWLNQPRASLGGALGVQVLPPEGWSVYTPWPLTQGGTVYLPGNVEELLDSAIALGRFEVYELRDGTAFRARILLPPAEDVRGALDRASDLAHAILSAYRYFGGPPDAGTAADLMAVVIETDGGPEEAIGAALGSNLILARGTLGLPASLDEVIAREAVRLWIGDAIRTAPRWSPEALTGEPWITYGWPEYLAWRIRADSGQLGALQYWDHVRRTAHELASSPYVGTTSLAEAAKQVHSDAALARFVRAKGLLGALVLEQRLRTETEARLGLGDVAGQLYQKHNYYASGALVSGEEVVRLLGELTGADYTGYYTTVMHGIGNLDSSAIPELSGPPVGETRMLTTPDGLRLFYQWVDGPTQRAAIYLSGGPGRPPYDLMYLLAEPLEQYLDVAYLEQRGSGRSDGPGQGAYSVDAYINDVELLRQQIGAQRVTLIGHAWGGYCALNYALRYPEKIDSLILLAPIPSFPRMVHAQVQDLVMRAGKEVGVLGSQAWQLPQEEVNTDQDLADLMQLLVRTGAYGSDLAHVQDSLCTAYAHYVRISLLPEGLPLSNPEILPTLIARDGLLRYDLMTDLAPGGYPVLILHGERDRVVGRSLLEALSQQLGAELGKVPGAGHYLYMDDAPATAAAIISFLGEHPY